MSELRIKLFVDQDCGIGRDFAVTLANQLAKRWLARGGTTGGPDGLDAIRLLLHRDRLIALFETGDGRVLQASREIAPGRWKHCAGEEWLMLERELDDRTTQ